MKKVYFFLTFFTFMNIISIGSTYLLITFHKMALKKSKASRNTVDEILESVKKKCNISGIKERISVALKRSKAPHSTLKKTDEILENLQKKGNISGVKERISKELLEVFKSSTISVDTNLYDIMYSVQKNLAKIKDEAFVNGLIDSINFDKAMEINDKEIENTWELPHKNKRETEESIDQINNSKTALSSLEEKIPALENQLKSNISILAKISEEQKSLKNDPRWLDDIEEDLKKYRPLKTTVWNLIISLSNIINAKNKEETEGWITPEERDVLLRKYNEIDKSDVSEVASEFWIDCWYSITTMKDIADINRIKLEQQHYITLSKSIDEKITELEHEKTLRELIDSLKKDMVDIPDWFLPFGSSDTIAKVGNNHEDTNRIVEDFQNKLIQVGNFKKEIRKIRKRYDTNFKNLENIKTLQQFHEDMNNEEEVDKCQKKLGTIIDICKNNLHLWDKENYKSTLGEHTISLWWWLKEPLKLDFISWNLSSSNRSATYSLCDAQWNALTKIWNSFSISKLKLEWISLDNTNQTIIIDNFKTEPIEWVKFPLNLNLAIKVNIVDQNTWLNIEHLKPINLKIDLPKLPQANRKNAYESINSPTMDERIASKYDDQYRENIENEIIWDILRKWWNKHEVNKIYKNERERDSFIERIRKRLKIHFPFLMLANLQQWFKEEIIKEDKNIPIQHLINEDAFKKYIENNRKNDLNDYATKTIKENISQNRDIVDSILLTFYWPAILSDGHKKRSNNNDYSKFLIWKEAEQDCDWNKVVIKVVWINKISATIRVNGKEEQIEATSHDRLIERILDKEVTRDGSTLDEKIRCQLALWILKAVVKLSPQKLSKQIPNQDISDGSGHTVNCNRLEIDLDGTWNLRYRWSKVNTRTQNKEYINIFDESTVNRGEIDIVKNHIQMISMQINNILNWFAQDYQEATNPKKIENMFLLRYDTDIMRIRAWYIKNLWAKTNYKFDFDGLKIKDLKSDDITISFKEWKFVVEGKFNEKDYKYEAKDLWYILRQGGEVFYGLQPEIFNAINEKYVEQLRTNKLIQKENFAIADLNENKTWRVYFYDVSWDQLSYLEIDDVKSNPLGSQKNAGRMNSKNIPDVKTICSLEERKEFFQNPLLAWRLLREMRKMLRLVAPRKISKTKANSTKK